MRSPRWRKVLGDLWSNKTRTILVVMSIAIGVFAIGMIAGARVLMLAGAHDSYAASHPASATEATAVSPKSILAYGQTSVVAPVPIASNTPVGAR